MSRTNVAGVDQLFEAKSLDYVEQHVAELGTGEDVLDPVRIGATMTPNGLRSFAVRPRDPRCPPLEQVDVRTVDPQTAARRYLAVLMAVPAAPMLPAGMPTDAVEFVLSGTETVALTGARVVKFIQHYRRIPVYGSLVTVELDADNTLLSIHTALGWPAHVEPVATVSPAQALTVAGPGRPDEAPGLWYFFDGQARSAKWRLVYIVAGVPNTGVGDASVPAPCLGDDVVDAHSGRVVACLPRVQSAVSRMTGGRLSGH